MAERGRFIEAYIEHKSNLLKDEAKKFLKGCPQHFRQSVSRISRNHAIIDCTLSSNFTSMTLKLLTINNKEFYNRVKSLQGKWPKANSWLEWWIYTDAGPMLFPALSTMNKDLSNLLPTTNAQESMHHCYCLSGATQQSIITKPERWERIAEKYDTTKPTCVKRSIKKGAGVKDHCPSDTSKALLKKILKEKND
ncbi:13803_t:CDS:2 [Entrophospora sp. SA101]|nr:13803_t:CDS:2 [Entrophospora sp. SA101]